jgi:hypothetical protein
VHGHGQRSTSGQRLASYPSSTWPFCLGAPRRGRSEKWWIADDISPDQPTCLPAICFRHDDLLQISIEFADLQDAIAIAIDLSAFVLQQLCESLGTYSLLVPKSPR